jgi:hypothetical protein
VAEPKCSVCKFKKVICAKKSKEPANAKSMTYRGNIVVYRQALGALIDPE